MSDDETRAVTEFYVVGRNRTPKVVFSHEIAVTPLGFVAKYLVEGGPQIEYYTGPRGAPDSLDEAARRAGADAVNDIANRLSDKLLRTIGGTDEAR